jgi:hypothetical protein
MTVSRRQWLLLGLPVLAVVGGFLVGRGAAALSTLTAPEPPTLVQAVAQGQWDTIVRMIEAGEDPGLPIVLEQPIFGWSRGDVVSPLLVGIAQGDKKQVAFLLSSTKHKADAPNDQALCVVARFGHSDVAEVLFRLGVPGGPEKGCDGHQEMPEDVAMRFRNVNLAVAIRNYRTDTRVVRTSPDCDCQNAEAGASGARPLKCGC